MLLIIILLLVCDSIGHNININVTEHSVLEQEIAQCILKISEKYFPEEPTLCLQTMTDIYSTSSKTQQGETILTSLYRAAHMAFITFGNGQIFLPKEMKQMIHNPLSIIFILPDLQMQPTIFYRYMERFNKYFMCQDLRIILVSLTVLNSENIQSQMARFYFRVIWKFMRVTDTIMIIPTFSNNKKTQINLGIFL